MIAALVAAAAVAAQPPPSFAFGRAGGNIVPLAITISSSGPVRTATRRKTVSVHGGCSPRFERVWRALASATGVD